MADADTGFRSSDMGPIPDDEPSSSTSGAATNGSGAAATNSNNAVPAPDSPDSRITQPPKIGVLDDAGQKIEKIFWSTQQFVIYQADGQIRYVLPPSYEVAKNFRHRIANLGGLRSSIEDLKADNGINANEKQRAATETAWALSLAFEDDGQPPSTQPNEILLRVDTRLRSLVKSEYRKLYVFANLAAFCAIEIILIAMVLLGTYVLQDRWPPAIGRYALFCVMGALGAFLSVIMRIRTIDVDINLSIWEHTFTGVTRILIGVIGAIVTGLALDSHLIDPTFGLNKVNPDSSAQASGYVGQPLAMYLIFSFIAGFSESIVPNILRQGEQVVSGGNNDLKDGPIVKDMKP
jgi:hypothetical protein